MRGILATVACVGVLSFGCTDDDDDVILPPEEMPPGETPPEEQPPPQPPVQRVELAATEYRFNPSTIEASPGQPLLVVINNIGDMEHSFAAELPDRLLVLEPFVQPGTSGEIQFNAPSQTGTFTFYCPVPGHRELGMVGTLTVR